MNKKQVFNDIASDFNAKLGKIKLVDFVSSIIGKKISTIDRLSNQTFEEQDKPIFKTISKNSQQYDPKIFKSINQQLINIGKKLDQLIRVTSMRDKTIQNFVDQKNYDEVNNQNDDSVEFRHKKHNFWRLFHKNNIFNRAGISTNLSNRFINNPFLDMRNNTSSRIENNSGLLERKETLQGSLSNPPTPSQQSTGGLGLFTPSTIINLMSSLMSSGGLIKNLISGNMSSINPSSLINDITSNDNSQRTTEINDIVKSNNNPAFNNMLKQLTNNNVNEVNNLWNNNNSQSTSFNPNNYVNDFIKKIVSASNNTTNNKVNQNNNSLNNLLSSNDSVTNKLVNKLTKSVEYENNKNINVIEKDANEKDGMDKAALIASVAALSSASQPAAQVIGPGGGGAMNGNFAIPQESSSAHGSNIGSGRRARLLDLPAPIGLIDPFFSREV